MAYKNIDINELGLKQKITYRASRVAFFVPRLLAKLATKVIVNPVTKLVTGETHEEVKAAATDIAMQVQADQAEEMQEKIDEGKQNLDDWKNDKEYYISNLGKYKSYESTVNDLVKKQAKLLKSPKRLLVAKTYLSVMGSFIQKHKEEKANEKLVKEVVEEYVAKRALLERKNLEIEALRQALKKAEEEKVTLENDVSEIEVANPEIVAQTKEQMGDAPVLSDEMIDNMSNFAKDDAIVVEGSIVK